ncbi:MAG: hypothetical protein GF307_00820 [candidate division Zixibacteria bacterium]|nr:hypothetical protein [candidate division Zixibacteria bacterium]
MFIDADNINILLMLLPVLAYAEIHYRFRGLPSLLHKAEPEIILDCPRRLEPGKELPVSLIIKDADKYPVTIHSIEASPISEDEEIKRVLKLISESFEVRDYLYHKVIPIKNDIIPKREFDLELKVKYSLTNELLEASSDNHTGTSHKPLRVFNSKEPWPREPGWYTGDIHTHSDATDDFVEFGAPIPLYARNAASIGIDWVAVTDHSYDIDDEPGKCYAPDPDLKRWKNLAEKVKRVNGESDIVFLLGEEVSCGSEENHNIHLIGLDIQKFIPGFGDSGESWFHNRPNQTANDVIQEIIAQGGFAIAAHPGECPAFLEKLLLNRGPWRYQDLNNPNLRHFQVLNGRRTESFRDGLKQWIKILLEGKKKFIVAGSDAHGNFNRLRQIKTPFLSMRESDHQIFGISRTIVFLGEQPLNKENLINALLGGNCVISDGPFLNLYFQNSMGNRIIPGNSIPNFAESNFELYASLISSEEFGDFERFVVYSGVNGVSNEDIFYERTEFKDKRRILLSDFNLEGEFTEHFHGYIRGELTTDKGHICLTNPIWIQA